jgi:hypothetical protein
MVDYDAVTLDIGETATYAKREITWHPTGKGEGLLVIRLWEWTRRRKGANAGRLGYEADVYQVMEIDPNPGVIGRCFGLLNRTDASQELPYRVTIGRDANCTCKAGRCRTETDKHVDAMRELLDTGVFDGTDDDAGEGRDIDATGEPTAFELAGA